MSNPEAAPRDEFLDSLLGDFFDESSQLLDRLNENLLHMDEWVRSLDDPRAHRCDETLLNEMFRSAHSLKGLSAMLGLKDINHLTHKVENVFDAARKDELAVDGDVVELMFQAIDRLGGLVESLKEPGSGPVECESVIDSIGQMLKQAGAERQQSSQAEAERALAAATAEAAATPTEATATATPAEVAATSTPTEAVATTTPAEVAAAAPPPVPAPPEPAPTPAPAEPETAIDLFEGLRDEAEISDKYLSIFIDEAALSLDEITETLLALENGGTRDALEKLLVTSHRVKGSAASVGLNRAAKLAHLMEDLLQDLVEKAGTVSPRMADALLRSTDALRQYVDDLRAGGGRPDHFSESARELLASQSPEAPGGAGVSPVLPGATGGTPASPEPPPRGTAEAPVEREQAVAPAQAAAPEQPVPAERLSEEVRATVARLAPEGTSPLVGQVWFQPRVPLVGLKARLLFEKLSNLGDVCHFFPPAGQLDDLEELDKIAFGLVTDKAPATVARHLRVAGVQHVVVEPLRAEEAAASSPPPAGEGRATSGSARQETLREEILQQEKPAAEPFGVDRADAAASATRQIPRGTTSRTVPARPESPLAARAGEAGASGQAGNRPADAGGRPNETLRVDIDRLDQLMNLAGQLVINKARLSRISDSLAGLASNRQALQAFHNAAQSLERMAAAGDSRPSAEQLQQDLESMRSQARRVQHDLETVRREVEALSHVHGVVSDLSEAIHQLDRVTDGIQRSVMDTRMVPIGPLFARFKRVVRDITRSNGKSVRLVIDGEKTELDKRMIDELGDPLIHIVRNSADHGIELPEVRAAAGKPAEGTITLDAFHRGNSIVIQVTDDGKGLDAERILQKAIEKGLVTAADAERMTRQQIYQLIWEPGLSTAEKVTEVSGRGMGMDIVKSKIEALNGSIDLDSTFGQGTTLTIKLPLTLAILPSLMVELEGDVFAMPVEAVVEIVSVRRRDIRTVQGKRMAVVRGRVISLVNLNEIFHWNRAAARTNGEAADEVSLVIVGEKGQELGLTVNRVLGEEDVVIKSIAENFRNVPGIAGASILGDGRVSLILDVLALIDMAAHRATATPVA